MSKTVSTNAAAIVSKANNGARVSKKAAANRAARDTAFNAVRVAAKNEASAAHALRVAFTAAKPFVTCPNDLATLRTQFIGGRIELSLNIDTAKADALLAYGAQKTEREDNAIKAAAKIWTRSLTDVGLAQAKSKQGGKRAPRTPAAKVKPSKVTSAAIADLEPARNPSSDTPAIEGVKPARCASASQVHTFQKDLALVALRHQSENAKHYDAKALAFFDAIKKALADLEAPETPATPCAPIIAPVLALVPPVERDAEAEAKLSPVTESAKASHAAQPATHTKRQRKARGH